MVPWVCHHHETLVHVELGLHLLDVQCLLPVDLGLVDHLLSLHGFLEHLCGQLLVHKPSSSVVLLIDDLAGSRLWRHLLESVDDCQVLGLYVLVEVLQAAQCFWLHWSFGGQFFKGYTGSVYLQSHIVD